ncbi:antigen WC1.1-like [Clupea harengus]|uniref:Antigen WC1.1-like n=1 Tax=Clupea harengus TaxID=7950 RepID=A0A8M1KP14_CLUHA|nr:antigen WC1.1-like [Clupea harengus]
MSHTLCLNLGCSNAVSASPSDTLPTGPLHHFSCTGSEVRLLQCASQKSTCNSKPVSVICSGSLKFNLTEQCRGQIKVWHGGKWKVACMREKDETTADLLCEHFPGCGGFSHFTQRHAKTPGETLLSCDEANSLEYCTTNASCQRNDITEIYCDGYQRPQETYYRPLPISLIAGVSVGLLLLLLAIVIALVLRKKKQRRRITDLLHGRHGFSTNTSNLARDDFQDLELRVTEERDVGMKNQANGQEKELDQASSEYDDVDEEAASLHTYREASEAPDPGGNTTDNPPPLPARDGELDDGDDYEEGYDDVAEPTAEEGIEHGVPSQSEERELSVEPDAEDYVQPDAEE